MAKAFSMDEVNSPLGIVKSVDANNFDSGNIFKVYGVPEWRTGDPSIDGKIKIKSSEAVIELPNEGGPSSAFTSFPKIFTDFSWDINVGWDLQMGSFGGFSYPTALRDEWITQGTCSPAPNITNRVTCEKMLGFGAWEASYSNPALIFFDDLIKVNNWDGITRGFARHYNEDLNAWGTNYALDGLPCDTNNPVGSFNFEGVCVEKEVPWSFDELAGLTYPIHSFAYQLSETNFNKYDSVNLGSKTLPLHLFNYVDQEEEHIGDFDISYASRNAGNSWKPAVFDDDNNLIMLSLSFCPTGIKIPDSINNLTTLEILDVGNTGISSFRTSESNLEITVPSPGAAKGALWLMDNPIEVFPDLTTLNIGSVYASGLSVVSQVPNISGFLGNIYWDASNGSNAKVIYLKDGICSSDYTENSSTFVNWLLDNGCQGNLTLTPTVVNNLKSNVFNAVADLDPNVDQAVINVLDSTGNIMQAVAQSDWDSFEVNLNIYQGSDGSFSQKTPIQAGTTNWTNIYDKNNKLKAITLEVVDPQYASYSPKIKSSIAYTLNIDIPTVNKGAVAWTTSLTTAEGSLTSPTVYIGDSQVYDSTIPENNNIYLNVINIGTDPSNYIFNSNDVLSSVLVTPANLAGSVSIPSFSYDPAAGDHWLHLRLSYNQNPTTDDEFLSTSTFYVGDNETEDSSAVNFKVQ